MSIFLLISISPVFYLKFIPLVTFLNLRCFIKRATWKSISRIFWNFLFSSATAFHKLRKNFITCYSAVSVFLYYFCLLVNNPFKCFIKVVNVKDITGVLYTVDIPTSENTTPGIFADDTIILAKHDNLTIMIFCRIT